MNNILKAKEKTKDFKASIKRLGNNKNTLREEIEIRLEYALTSGENLEYAINSIELFILEQKEKLCNLYDKRRRDGMADLNRKLNEKEKEIVTAFEKGFEKGKKAQILDVSSWKNMGIKYKYFDFFEKKIK